MNLFLDDIRNPTDIHSTLHRGIWEEFPSLMDWKVVRSYQEFVNFILKNGMPNRISYDHDLSWEHYPNAGDSLSAPIPYETFTEKTGYDCAKWLTNYCLEKKLELPDFYVHSFNPVGRMNITNHLLNFEQQKRMFKKSP